MFATGGHSYWTLAEWVGLLESCKQFEDASFSREDGNLCFYLAKFEVCLSVAQFLYKAYSI